MGTIIAGHQPNYLPYLGFFDKIKNWRNQTLINERIKQEILLRLLV